MPDKLHKTKGFVLRTIKYGETSVIVLVLTEKFGIQSYLVNGVRKATKKGSGKANMFQPAAMLDLVVYHNESKNLQRIKEFKWGFLYQHLFSDVPKNAVALFMVELLTRCLKQPEHNEELFQFCEDAFTILDESTGTVTANFPLFFALRLTNFFGFMPQNKVKGPDIILDLKEGEFLSGAPDHPHFIEGRPAEIVHELLKVQHPAELDQIKLNKELRRQLLMAFETYYALHLQEFGSLKTLPVLREVLG